MNFNDSIMIFMVFWCPEGPLEVQKTKKTSKRRDGEQKQQNIVQNYDLEWHADSMGFLVGPEQSQEF